MDSWSDFLTQQKANGLRRELNPAAWRKNGKICIGGKEYIDFSSNDYLGLANHPKLKAAAAAAIKKYGAGSGASRLLSGDLEIFHLLEEKTAKLKQKEAALTFNSGYQLNVSVFMSLAAKADAIFVDKLAHASLLDGIRLSGAQWFRFHHNDLNHLEMLLKKYRAKYRRAFIVTESIFSMDGDRAPLKEIVQLKDKYRCQLFVDEAHATGVFGKNGGGRIEAEGLAGQVDIIMGTFGKALGSIGAYAAGSKSLVKYLVNTCRSFIYSTALPPATAAASLAAIDLLKKEPVRRVILLKNAEYLRRRLKAAGLQVRGDTQIIPVIVGSAEAAINLSNKLKVAGFWALPIRPPTVPPGEARVRLSLCYDHSQKILQKLAGCLT